MVVGFVYCCNSSANAIAKMKDDEKKNRQENKKFGRLSMSHLTIRDKERHKTNNKQDLNSLTETEYRDNMYYRRCSISYIKTIDNLILWNLDQSVKTIFKAIFNASCIYSFVHMSTKRYICSRHFYARVVLCDI